MPGLLPDRLTRNGHTHVARYAWPAGVAGAGLAWYTADSLRHRREGRDGYELRGECDPAGPDFLRAAEAITGAPISWGNDVELLVNGDQIFPCYLETIRGAQRTLCMLTYAYWRGGIAEEVADALCERAAAGVECNVIIDAMGGVQMERDVLQRMMDGGVRVSRFRPPKPYAVRRLANRTHRKILVADGEVGLTGGVGIAEEWTGDAQDPDHWRDTHVRVRGPVVRGLFGAFAENWLEATGEVLVGDGYTPELEAVDDGGPMQVVRSSAGVGDTNVEALYYLAIAAARESLDLTAAYFVPRPAFSDALEAAARRGVRVRVLVPGEHIDKAPVRVAGRASYDELIDAGVEIHEYGPTMLHAKALVLDGVWSSVGSVNFDNRSFQLHDEATLCVQSRTFAAKLTEQFERDLAVSDRIEREPVVAARAAAARRRGGAAAGPAGALDRGARADEPARVQLLGELDGVGRRALAQVVRDHPHLQPALVRGVAAQAADEDVVVAGGAGGGRVGLDQREAGHRLEQRARLLDLERLAGLDVDRLRVRGDDRDAGAGDGDRDRLVAEDLARLEHHLALLVGVVVAVEEVAGAAVDVERDRLAVDLGRRASPSRAAPRGSGSRAPRPP